ncbi:MAG: aspartate ammonia-lyase [Candidatus Aminicenantes bacterium]|nr:aspartate ammonia-lyase [Candidatus Aminicenantes bacterium]NIM83365.1 aspartate ammonia-lyase [Candidatus Aminicenantes bacterium]NIN22729.1 aspartate ammonia-lyase [Candidatus Aminicenantes bacterium]NIN46489.1 aspartate ammonia-lyase [Candidatus Aminicenantes bacterium]NIN89371.1 aspartate ammonia-lyase [Candidatus Aminicenantes bacterium]
MEKKKGFRIERDSLGEMHVPEGALWGPQTQRAVENFPISGYRFPRSFIRAIGMVKYAAAKANISLKLLKTEIGKAVIQAANEVMDGQWDDQFVVDIFQTGSGTSTNMNANEVIANRANQALGAPIGSKKPVHPNDHVNMGQSSNDVIPTCLHISAVETIKNRLLPALSRLQQQLEEKANVFDSIVKIGRTHLQDATPVRLGQEFGGYSSMVAHGIQRIEKNLDHLQELALGGTAVGTGINAHPDFAGLTIAEINQITGCEFREAGNHFEAQGAKDAVVEVSGALKTLAVSLTKIANDIKWMGAGPHAGLGELNIPPVQPGSSIMPGKVNPVIAEALCQVAAQVIGNDAVVTISGLSGNFELNVMMPVMAHNLLSSLELLTNAVNGFTDKCLVGLTANEARCKELVEKSLAMVTALNPYIGYDAAAEIAKEAYRTGKSLREVILEKKIMPEDKLNEVLDPYSMTTNK